MGEENVKLSDGVLYIEGKEFGPTRLASFECNVDEVIEEHRDEIISFQTLGEAAGEATMSFKVLFDTLAFYKLTGMWDYIINNCPNRRVVHLAQFSKKKRVRDKNFKRALHIVGKLLEE